MRRLLKMTVSAVAHTFGQVSYRCLSGRPPAPLGGRILTSPKDIFHHNMWYFCVVALHQVKDHVQWSPEEMEKARQKAEENSREQIPLEEQGMTETQTNIGTDFTKCIKTSSSKIVSGFSLSFLSSCPRTVTQVVPQKVGCGAGNSVFPITNAIRGSDAFLYCFDFSSRAIQLVRVAYVCSFFGEMLQEHPDYNPAVCHAFVHDICDDISMFPFPQESLDVIAVVFVLSSIHPERIQKVVNRLAGYLKHGGIILFRDYGRYDLAQLRFKKGQCLSENFYTRQDGTCVYFFMKDEIHRLFTNAGLEEVQNLEDRRLQVNRGKKVVMHRVWMQSKYRKPLSTPGC
ncbi:hypothetical protein QTP70_027163 [Hemibagrus guttatus]|uniref:tRNA N(3)-cytidine methyltransferase n=1 Tax=Hemibagrus guttatus TaxID=175788 RepID=A0AAE0V814_9TELE|nr:hypothetical protein QTP70_027163 [Hemibagrus guttatus]